MKKNILFVLMTASLFADEAPATAAASNNYMPFIMIALAALFFYFVLYRPEQKRRKKTEAQRNAIKKGDKVTAVGIIGTVDKVLDNTLVLKMYDGSKIEVLKAAVSDVQSSVEVTSEEKKD